MAKTLIEPIDLDRASRSFIYCAMDNSELQSILPLIEFLPDIKTDYTSNSRIIFINGLAHYLTELNGVYYIRKGMKYTSSSMLGNLSMVELDLSVSGNVEVIPIKRCTYENRIITLPTSIENKKVLMFLAGRMILPDEVIKDSTTSVRVPDYQNEFVRIALTRNQQLLMHYDFGTNHVTRSLVNEPILQCYLDDDSNSFFVLIDNETFSYTKESNVYTNGITGPFFAGTVGGLMMVEGLREVCGYIRNNYETICDWTPILFGMKRTAMHTTPTQRCHVMQNQQRSTINANGVAIECEALPNDYGFVAENVSTFSFATNFTNSKYILLNFYYGEDDEDSNSASNSLSESSSSSSTEVLPVFGSTGCWLFNSSGYGEENVIASSMYMDDLVVENTYLYVFSGGVATNITCESSGIVRVNDGGTCGNLTVLDGTSYIFTGGVLTNATIDGGTLWVQSGTASNLEIISGTVNAKTSCLITEVTVYEAGALHLTDAGKGENITVKADGTLTVDATSIAFEVTAEDDATISSELYGIITYTDLGGIGVLYNGNVATASSACTTFGER